MLTSDRTEYLTIHWTHVGRSILWSEMVAIGKRWHCRMQMIRATAQNHWIPWILTWVVPALAISQRALLRVSSAGTNSPITVHSERAALAMEF